MRIDKKLRYDSRSARLARRLIIIHASLAASLIAHSLTSAAVASSALEEPVFGLYYYPQEAHFAELKTNDLLPACKKSLSDITPLPTTLTLFAQYKHDLTKIYIAGYDDNLKIYVIRDGTCDAGIPIMAILQRHHIPRDPIDGPMLSNEEVSDLFGDALVRYASALGGKKRFSDGSIRLRSKPEVAARDNPNPLALLTASCCNRPCNSF